MDFHLYCGLSDRIGGELIMKNNHDHTLSPKSHIIGFIWSIVLTLIALFVILKAPVTVPIKLVIIVILACLQFLVQLIYFMHITEPEEKAFGITNLLYGVIIAIAIVAGSIWIMLIGIGF